MKKIFRKRGKKEKRLRVGDRGKGREEGNRKEGRKERRQEGREGHTWTKLVPQYLGKYFTRTIIIKQGFLSFIAHNYLLLQI